MEKEKDINSIGFNIPDSVDGVDKSSPTNFVDAENPQGSGGGNDGYTDEDPIYPPDPDSGLTNEEIINNHLLSQRQHRKFIDDRRSELAGQQALPLIGMVALAYLIFS